MYDFVDVKKKRVTHSRSTNSQVVQNRFSFVEILTGSRDFVN
jgi:hypothetical protein